MDLAPLTAPLAHAGLDVFGVAAASAWDREATPARRTDALLPGARAILVFGNTGARLWDAFVADLARDPRGLTEEANPLDAYVRRAVRAADAALGDAPRRWVFAAADTDLHVDFRLLAGLAGLGAQSRLGLLIHPTWGTWIGLRAACFVGADVAPTPPPAAHPCDGCAAPCATACVGDAFVDGRWDVGRCAAFHRAADTCARTCASRLACPVGAENRYPSAQFAYHNERASGRAALRARLGIPDGADRYEGTGPYWGDWQARVDVKGDA